MPNTGIKTFVLDTSVLLHNPAALFVFEDNNIVIPFAVLEEIDKFKSVSNDVGRNARQCVRYLDRLRETGPLTDGVPLVDAYPETTRAGDNQPSNPPSGSLRIDATPHKRPDAISADSNDNRIIASAWALHEGGENVVFVSKDINARIKADALGIASEDFENQKVDIDTLYSGYRTLTVPSDVIDHLYAEKMLALAELEASLPPPKNGNGNGSRLAGIVPNEFVLLVDAADDSHTGLARRLADTEHVIPVSSPRRPVFGIMARNVQQTMALDLLLDDEVRLVTMIGSAGTGKTLLAVAAGMTKVFNDEAYEKLLVARPIMPMGRDIGYLPGDKDEKLISWMQPIFDNLSYLLSTRGHPMQAPDSHSTEQRINRLIGDGRLVLEPLTYIRGRSIPHQFMIVDEAQNLSPHEVKTIISRVGEGTKIVLTGDIEQIDNPYLDGSSNGLSYVVERMKGSGLVGHVTLQKSERSNLASLATDRL
ncbi:MAG: PhoH family protein [Phycisphaerales bacterium]|nr:PhoH family protein [Phycisphaerales bacterium]